MAELLKFNSLGEHNSVTNGNIVFLHGWGLNSAIFQPMAERLAQHYTITCIDLPGFGDNNQCIAKPYSLENITAMVAQCIKEPAIIIGWSLGGLVATELALHHADKVSALVTVTSSPHFVAGNNWPGIKAELLSMFHQQLTIDSEKTINGFLKIQALGSDTVRQDIKQIKTLIEQRPKPNNQVLDDSLSLLETVDLRSKVQALTLPVFRMYGRLDSLVPKAVIEQIDKLLPSSDRYTFQHASHAPFISHSDEFFTVLCDWITGNIKS
ncbi:pimeloyl-ACP methyl ester esterase BioH [Colwelliaceae bacterium BS250]